MPKIPKSVSLNLSMVLSALFLAVCTVGLFVLPMLTGVLIKMHDSVGTYGGISESEKIIILILAYFLLGTFIFADVILFTILHRVKIGKVFTPITVSLIRGVSYCCFIVGLLFAILGIYFILAFPVAFAAILLGLSLRVVKNVMEEATEIKNENELTV